KPIFDDRIKIETHTYIHMPTLCLRHSDKIPIQEGRLMAKKKNDQMSTTHGNNCVVFMFDEIRTTKHSWPTAEYGLVQMIKNKLVGSALRIALSKKYNEINTLLTASKTRFAPIYSSPQLYGELFHIAQHPDESVDYGSRVTMILYQLKTYYYIRMKTPNQAAYSRNFAETNAVRNFLIGLQSEIYNRMNTRDNVNLNNAIECNNCMGYGHDSRICSTIDTIVQATANLHFL
ncbi:hypothetical protein ALC53_04543, partial [Atta colombica]